MRVRSPPPASAEQDGRPCAVEGRPEQRECARGRGDPRATRRERALGRRTHQRRSGNGLRAHRDRPPGGAQARSNARPGSDRPLRRLGVPARPGDGRPRTRRPRHPPARLPRLQRHPFRRLRGPCPDRVPRLGACARARGPRAGRRRQPGRDRPPLHPGLPHDSRAARAENPRWSHTGSPCATSSMPTTAGTPPPPSRKFPTRSHSSSTRRSSLLPWSGWRPGRLHPRGATVWADTPSLLPLKRPLDRKVTFA